MCICICVCVCRLTQGADGGKRVTAITSCAWCGAKPLASIKVDACVCACVCVPMGVGVRAREREHQQGWRCRW